MAIATLNSHIHAAIEMQKQIDGAYLVFGRTSAWTDDENPPNEVEDRAEIEEIIGYKKLKQFSLAKPLEDGVSPRYPVVVYGGLSWELIPTDKAYEEKARWVYAEAEIYPEEFPLGMYRQVGIHLGLSPNNGVSKLNLLPSEVSNTGTLQFYENREPQNRTSNVYVLEQFLIKV